MNLIPPTSPILNAISKEVAKEAIELGPTQGVIDHMLQLAAGKGHNKEDSRQMVGLAAVQIGVSKRIILIDTTADGSHKSQHLQVIINPQITMRSAETLQGREGCWSCGNICGIVERAKQVTLEGVDRSGKAIKLELSDFVARIAQHEVDHLDGIRFPDRIPASKPEWLHWVEPAEFEEYRHNWQHWRTLCPREKWEQLATGTEDA